MTKQKIGRKNSTLQKRIKIIIIAQKVLVSFFKAGNTFNRFYNGTYLSINENKGEKIRALMFFVFQVLDIKLS